MFCFAIILERETFGFVDSSFTFLCTILIRFFSGYGLFWELNNLWLPEQVSRLRFENGKQKFNQKSGRKCYICSSTSLKNEGIAFCCLKNILLYGVKYWTFFVPSLKYLGNGFI